jgi:hypothetical protein
VAEGAHPQEIADMHKGVIHIVLVVLGGAYGAYMGVLQVNSGVGSFYVLWRSCSEELPRFSESACVFFFIGTPAS